MKAAERKVLVCFAVKEEARAFQKLAGERGNLKIILVGIGKRNAERAIRAALTKERPQLIMRDDAEVYEARRVDELTAKAIAADFNGDGTNELVVGTSEKATMAAGNNPKLATIESLGVNVYELLKYDQVIFSKEAVLALQEVVKP